MENKTKEYECFIFECGNGCNIAIEAEDKLKALEIFKDQFAFRYDGDFKVLRLSVKLDVDGNYTNYKNSSI